MTTSSRFAVLIAALFAFCSISVVAQSTRTLELETDDGPIEVPLDPSVPMRILNDGNISATAEQGFSCPTGGPSCEDVKVSLLSSDGGTLSASVNPARQGNIVSISWDSLGAWSCTGSGLPGTVWNDVNPKGARGQQDVDTSSLQPGTTYNVGLECANGPVIASRSLAFAVEEESTEPAPKGCEQVDTLSSYPSWTQTDELIYDEPSVDADFFQNVFGLPFPDGGAAHAHLRKNSYVAMRFTTPADLNAGHSGSINSVKAGSWFDSGPGARMMTISRCPGAFKQSDLEDPDCYFAAAPVETQIPWVGPGHSWAGFRCELQADTVYYVNMLFSESPAGTMPPVQSACRSSGETHCGLIMQPRTNY